MKIQGKITLAMLVAFFVGLVLASIGAYIIVTRNAMEDSLQNARIMMEGASAIRTYTSESVSPLLQQQMRVEFLPYAIPSFAHPTGRTARSRPPNAPFVHRRLGRHIHCHDRHSRLVAALYRRKAGQGNIRHGERSQLRKAQHAGVR
jgi:hypothetical protein